MRAHVEGADWVVTPTERLELLSPLPLRRRHSGPLGQLHPSVDQDQQDDDPDRVSGAVTRLAVPVSLATGSDAQSANGETEPHYHDQDHQNHYEDRCCGHDYSFVRAILLIKHRAHSGRACRCETADFLGIVGRINPTRPH